MSAFPLSKNPLGAHVCMYVQQSFRSQNSYWLVFRFPYYEPVSWETNLWRLILPTHTSRSKLRSLIIEKKLFVCEQYIESAYKKKHERYNSGFETNLLNCKTWECGSFWEEALRQSYDLWLQWREREKERERKREGGQIQLTALVNMWGGVAGWEWWKWITTLWKIRFLPIISECNYKRRTENPFPQQAPSL